MGSHGVEIVVWLVSALVLLAIETFTLSFVAVYVALGAVCAAIAAAFGAAFGLQVIVFVGVAVLTLVFTRRPLRRALGRTPLVASGAQNIVGRHAVVTVAIPAGPGARGQVRIGTEFWTASGEGYLTEPIPEGATVEVIGLKGVAAVVKPIDGVGVSAA
jgi:membrane protein implicated in regulation of membrane protease activity